MTVTFKWEAHTVRLGQPDYAANVSYMCYNCFIVSLANALVVSHLVLMTLTKSKPQLLDYLNLNLISLTENMTFHLFSPFSLVKGFQATH